MLVLAALLTPVAPPPNLESGRYRVQYAILYPADQDGGVRLKVHKIGTSERDVIRNPVVIWGSRKECKVWIDGVLADRDTLLRWLPNARLPVVDLTFDPDPYGYGAVVEAKFTSRSK